MTAPRTEESQNEDWASPEEIFAAANALSNHEIKQLAAHAGFLIFKRLRYRAGNITEPEDLLGMAIERTLESTQSNEQDKQKGVRRWNKSQGTFVEHLRSTMESISNTLLKKESVEAKTVKLTPTKDGNDPWDEKRARQDFINEDVSGKFIFDKLQQHFSETPQMIQFLEAIEEGLEKKETMELLDLDENGYEASRKRYQRAIKQNGKRWAQESLANG